MTMFSGVNELDLIAAVIFFACALYGMGQGFIKAAFNLAGSILSIYIAFKIYPIVTEFIRDNLGIYDKLKAGFIESMNISEIVRENLAAGEEAIFSNLPLPDMFKDILVESNIPKVYEILGVSQIEDYIGGYLANIMISGIAFVAVFILSNLLIRVIGTLLNIVSKLPVINTFNRLGGFCLGCVLGGICVWAVISFYTIWNVGAGNAQSMLAESIVAGYLAENGFLFKGFL